jgi:peptide/nickel transport system permease protein
VTFSVPVFVVGYIGVLVFAMWLKLLPVQGHVPPSAGLWPWFRGTILPSAALSCTLIAVIARITRTSLLEVLGEDFIRTARAKGLAPLKIMLRHALPAASVPIATTIGSSFVSLLNGVVIVETVFGIPGLGRMSVSAVLNRDFPIIEGIVLISTGTYILINLALDILYAYLDPRISYG